MHSLSIQKDTASSFVQDVQESLCQSANNMRSHRCLTQSC